VVWPAVLFEIVKGSGRAEGGGVGRRRGSHHDGEGEAKEAYSEGDSGED
jgi:hypothetical protein